MDNNILISIIGFILGVGAWYLYIKYIKKIK